MDELTFDGVPLAAAPARPLPDVPVPDEPLPDEPLPNGPAPVTADAHAPDGAGAPTLPAHQFPVPGPVTVTAPALRIAAQLQRAHAAVLDAHEAIITWQLARAAASGTARPGGPAVPAPGQFPVPVPVPPSTVAGPLPVHPPGSPDGVPGTPTDTPPADAATETPGRPGGPGTPTGAPGSPDTTNPTDRSSTPTEAPGRHTTTNASDRPGTPTNTQTPARPAAPTEPPHAPTDPPHTPTEPPRKPTDPPHAPPGPPPPADGTSKALQALASALHTPDTGEATAAAHPASPPPTDATALTAVALTWRRPAPQHPTEPRVAGTDSGWQVLDGAGPLAEVAPADGPARPWPPRQMLQHPPDPRPLARARVSRLAAGELDALVDGQFGEVFGAAFEQSGPPDALPARWPARLLDDLTVTGARDGAHTQGRLLATTRLPDAPAAPAAATAWAHMVAAALEALRVHAFRQGLHLCVPGARPVPTAGRPVRIETFAPAAPPGAVLRLDLHVSGTGMLPLPFATADCEITADGRTVARLWDVGVTLQPGPGVALLGRTGGSSRTGSSGRRVALDEFQIAFLAEGDHGAVRMPGLPRVTARVRPRLPRGDLRLVDRMTGRPNLGGYLPGTRGTWEYDVPQDPWFVRENNGTVPQLALMETALQPAGGFSGALGVSGEHPDESLSCRNLTGSIRLLADVELRSATVEQRITLRSHSPLPDGLMHRYGISLATGGVEFCTAEGVHGFLTPRLLAGQQGLDGDAPRRPWLDDHAPDPRGARRLHLADDTRLGHGRLALLDEVCLVPDGGVHGAGYVLCQKPVRADDWFFEQHFPYDPVLPGSVSVQMLYQAVHAFALHTGLVDHLREPRMSVAVGEELRWNYRGQILREHRRIRGEVHIRRVQRTGDRVLVCADGSVWRDGTRIYEVDNIAADFHAARAEEGGSW